MHKRIYSLKLNANIKKLIKMDITQTAVNNAINNLSLHINLSRSAISQGQQKGTAALDKGESAAMAVCLGFQSAKEYNKGVFNHVS